MAPEAQRETLKQKPHVVEKVFNRAQRYAMTKHIFEHVANNDVVAIQTIMKQYEGDNVNFIINRKVVVDEF